MRKILLLLFISIISFTGFSQDFSNKGRDFWVGYGYHQIMLNGNQQDMVLYFATDQVSNVTVSIPLLGYSVTYNNIAANTVFQTPALPKGGGSDARLFSEGLSNKGIHITSDVPVVAYAHIYNASVSGATVLYPVNTLGKDYYSVNFTNNSNSTNANCWFYVVAVDTGTTVVSITPSANTIGWNAGSKNTVTLTQGQVYNVMGVTSGNNGVDLTGSTISSVASGTGGCKRIAVFSGSGRIAISCNGTAPSSDNYMVQGLPKSAWGKRFLTTPSASYSSSFGVAPPMQNIYRVCVSDPTTVVTLNGLPIPYPLIGGFYYEIPSNASLQKIVADKPIMVAQYLPSQGSTGCGTATGDGDPEVIYLSPIEQSINTVRWDACHNSAINQSKHYINVVIPNSGTAISSVLLDGAPLPAGTFTVHPQDPLFSYALIRVSGSNAVNVAHVIQSDSGFNAIAYGYGATESYGYNAGTNVIDLYQHVGIFTPNGNDPNPVICTGTDFKFKVSLPYVADSIIWNLGNLPGTTTPNNNTLTTRYECPTVTYPCWDSSTNVNLVPIFWYSLPSNYNVSTTGSYNLSLTTFFPNAECGNSQDIPFTLQVINPPTPSFTPSAPSCYLEPVQFTETTSQIPKPTYKWTWDFGDPLSGPLNNVSHLKNPTHAFSGPGTYTINFSATTTSGCVNNAPAQQITIPDVPTATITGTTAVCLNSTSLPFVALTGAGGAAPYTINYSINGVGQPPVTSNAAGVYTITGIPTNVAGPFVYSLDSIKNSASTLCKRIITGQTATVTVNPLPTAVIAGATTVCLNAASPTITFTGSGGTAPYTFNYAINGTPQTPVVSNAAGIATLTAPTTLAGSFNYIITLVKESSTSLCSQALNVSTIVVVKALPSAVVGGTTAVCLNATSPTVTFTGSGGTAPYTFTYTLNGTPQPPAISNAAGTYTITVPTTVAGPFSYVLASVQEGSTNACIQPAVTGQQATITVNPVPTAIIGGATAVCLNAAPPPVTFTGSGGTAPYSFTYTINGVPQANVVSNAAGVATVPASTAVAGPFVYALTLVRDASPTLCSQALTNVTTTINVTPLPAASISNGSTICLNGTSPTITFTGSLGTAPYTFTYTLNGVPQAPVVSNAAGVYTITVPTNAAGPQTYALVSVQESGASSCIQPNITGQQAIVTVKPLPAVAIAATATAACLNAASPIVTFTGSGGTAPYTFNYMLNGVPQPAAISNAAGIYTIAVPTTAVGPFAYNLTSVQEGSTNACIQPAVTGQTRTVTINPLPTAVIAGGTTVCLNATAATITFTGSGTAAPYTFAYTINAVAQTPVISNAAGVATVTVPTGVAGPFIYAITLVTDASTSSCSKPLTNVATTINVTALPIASITGTTAVCLNAASPVITLTGAAGVAPYTFTYTLNGVPQPPVVSNAGGIYAITVPTTAAGPLVYAVTSVQENGPNTCVRLNITGQQATVTVNPLPVAVIASTTADVCVSGTAPTVSFTGSAGTAPYTFNYTINGAPQPPVVSNAGGIATVAAPTAVANTFVYALTSVTDGTTSACSQNQSGNTTVIVHPLPTALVTGNIEVCQNAAAPGITFTGAGGTAPYTFTYSINGGADQTVTTTVGNSVTVLQPTATANTYTYLLRVVKDGSAVTCSQLQSGTVVVKVNPLPTATISGTKSLCINSPAPDITFTGANGTAPYSFRYRINGGGLLSVTTTGTNTSVTVAVPTATAGVFTYSLENVADGTITACLQAQTGTAAVTVSNVFPNPSFTFSDPVCLPNAVVQFQNTSSIASGSMTYEWFFGDGSPNSSGFQPSHQYTAVGPFNVVLQATSNAGCVTTKPITVNSIHAQPRAEFSIDKPGGVCIGDNVVLRDLTDAKDGVVTKWNWDLGDGTKLTTNPVSYTYSSTSTYSITLYTINSFGCNSDTLTKSFTVHPYPVVDAGPDGIVLEGGSYILQPIVTNSADYQYLWSPATYLNSTTAANPTANVILDDITYTLVVTGRGGCVAPSDKVFIKVLKAPRIPNTFTPNGDGINELWLIDYLDTYPNCRVQVFTRTGQLVFQSTGGYKKPWDGKLGGKPLPFDTYYYIIEPGNGRPPMTGYVAIVK